MNRGRSIRIHFSFFSYSPLSERSIAVKVFPLLLVVAFVLGTIAAYSMNYSLYGYRVAKFGPITLDGRVNAANAIASMSEGLPSGYAKADVPGGTTFNFGVMAPEEEGEHSFVVKNIGTEDLSLKVGASTCKCTVGTLENNKLAPGEQTEVKLTWHVKTNAEKFGQSAELITNDPNRPAIRFEIEGDVIRQMEMNPKEWTFGEVAAGEPIALESTIYNFMEDNIRPADSKFSDEEINRLAKIEIQPYQPTEESDGARAKARQAFKIKVTIEPGLKQGPVSQNFNFAFERVDKDGNVVHPEGDKDSIGYYSAATTGRIVGSLSMIVGSKLQGIPGGGYAYEFGRLDEDDPKTAKAFVVLKGSERGNTNLRIGRIEPEGVIRAKLAKGTDRGSMVLYTLELELVPGDKPIDRLGLKNDDFGKVWIESDNPKVPPLQLMVKFALPGKS